MNKVLLTSTGGYPNPNSGGALKIIFLLLSHQSSSYNYDFLSYDYFIKDFVFPNNIDLSELNHPNYQQAVKRVLEKFKILKLISKSPYYYDLHLQRLRKRILEKSRKNNWSIIHAHHSISMGHLVKNPARKILTLHSKGAIDYDIRNSASGVNTNESTIKRLVNLEIKAIKYSDVITFPSKAAKKMFIGTYGSEIFDNKNTEIIYNGVEIDSISKIKSNFEFIKQNNNRVTFLNVANHVRPKNIDLLIEVLNILVNRLKRKEIRVYNIGWGTQTNIYLSLIKQYGLQDNFIFLGQLNNKQILSLMKSVGYFISLAEKVVFDMVVLESIASGLTTIVSNIGGNKEVIEHGKNGYLVDITSAEKTAYFLNSVNKIDAKDIIKSSRKYSVKNMITEYKDLYNSVV